MSDLLEVARHHQYLHASCAWRNRRDHPATTHPIGPGDRVHLCTAQAVWTVAEAHNDGTVTLAARDNWTRPMTVHPAHLDPADTHTTGELDGQTTIYDHMEDQCSR